MNKCPFCSFSTDNSSTTLTQHVIRWHQKEPNFAVKCRVCGSVYSKYTSFKSHWIRIHKAQQLEDCLSFFARAQEFQEGHDAHDFEGESSNEHLGFYNIEAGPQCAANEPTPEAHKLHPAEELQLQAAQFICFLRDQCNTTQHAINEMVSGIDHLVTILLCIIEDAILQRKNEIGWVSSDDISAMLQTLRSQSIFEGVSSAYLLNQFLKKHCSMVEPKKVVVQKRKVMWRNIPREVDQHFGYIVPFKEQLQALLCCEDVLDCVDNPRVSVDDIYKTVLDGFYYKTSSVYQMDNHALAFILYFDDVEVADPLASKTKIHKLRMYYWVLANIHPELRSTLKAINLLAVVKTKVVKEYGHEPFLMDFINTVNELSSSDGCVLNINGTERKFHGILLFVSADTPAACELAGFKESPHFAYRPCRHCLATREDLYSSFDERDYTLRTAAAHSNQLAALERYIAGPQACTEEDEEGIADMDASSLMDVDQELDTQPQPTNPSVLYGINSCSVLSKVNGFDVTKGFPQEIFHVLIEGPLERECRFLLHDTIFKTKKMTLKVFNSILESLDFGHLNSDRPSPIDSDHLTKGLRQNGAQLMLLAVILPFIVMGRCDKEKLALFIELLKILNLCLAYEQTSEDAIKLRKMIKDHHEKFAQLYPGKLTPKFHFMIHFPGQILLFGCLRQQWTMRFEAFHEFFKRLVRILHNMKNISHSLAYRHQSRRCGEMMLPIPSVRRKYLHVKNLIVGGKVVPTTQSPLLLDACQNIHPTDPVLSANSITVHGTRYFKGSSIIFKIDANNQPSFGIVSSVYQIQDHYALECYHCDSLGYEKELNAYEIRVSHRKFFTLVSDLCFPFPLLKLKLNGRMFVVVLHCNKLI